MPHLVGDGEHGIEVFLVVEQHVGVRAVGAPRIRARGLALVFVNVDPALLARLAQYGLIVLAERGERLHHQLVGLVKGQLDVKALHRRHVEVDHAHVGNADPFAIALHKARQRRYVPPHGGNEVVVDAHGHLIRKQRRFQRALVLRRARGKDVGAHRGVVERGDGGGKGLIGGIQPLKRRRAHAAVAIHHQGDVVGVGDAHVLALFVLDDGKFHVRVGEHGVNGVRRGGHLPGHGHDALLGLGERVRPLPLHLAQHDGELGKRRLFACGGNVLAGNESSSGVKKLAAVSTLVISACARAVSA